MTCEEVAQLLDSQEKLPPLRNLIMNFHISICDCCTNYKKQIDIIKNTSKEIHKINVSNELLEKITSSKADAIKKILNK